MLYRLTALSLLFACGVTPAAAQLGSPWQDDPFWDRPSSRYRNFDSYEPTPRRTAPSRQPSYGTGGEAVRNGGERPTITPVTPPIVAFAPNYPAGSIVIDTSGRTLYFVLPNRQAFQYPISVGREGFAWAGTEKISRKQAWPDWHPPEEMRQRDPKLPIRMTGGLKNPLGSMALYLGNTLYRIHGTNDEKTIGYASSSGCFRMMNSAVLHLAQFAQVGTSVTVVNSLPNAPRPAVAQAPLRQPAAPAAVRPKAVEPPPVARAEPPPLATRPPVARVEQPAGRLDAQVRREPLPAPQESAYRDIDPPPAPRDRTQGDEYRPWPRQQPSVRPERSNDIADVSVEPQDLDDYDPYAQRPLRAQRRPYQDRYAGRPFDRSGPPPSYYDNPETRIWYDDERDDY